MFNIFQTAIFLTMGCTAFSATIDYSVLSPRNDYGAVVAGDGNKADLALSYRTLNPDFSIASSRVSFWNTGYSDLAAALFADFNGGIMEITLTPIGNNTVTLNSFMLGSYFGGPARTASVFRVTDGTTTLWSSEPYNYALNASAAVINVGVSASQLRLLVGTDWNLGVNLLDYTTRGENSAIPEPSSAFLVLGASALLFKLRRR